METTDNQQPSVILKHAFLASLRDQNQVLFYRLMQDHLKELLGILYTPGTLGFRHSKLRADEKVPLRLLQTTRTFSDVL